MLAAPLAGLLISLLAGPQGADAITWDSPPGCPDRASLQRTITRRLGRKLAPGELTLVGHIVADAETPRFRLRLELTVDGHTQVRTLTDDRCRPLADATALLVALTVAPVSKPPPTSPTPPTDSNSPIPPPDPTDATADPSDTHNPTPPADPTDAQPDPDATPDPPAPTDPHPPIAPPTTSDPTPPATAPTTPAPPPRTTATRRRPGALIRLHAGPELGAVPAITGALGLTAGLLWRRARLELQGTWLAPRTEVHGANSVQVSVLAVALHGCARPGRGPLEFPLCGGLEAGPARGQGSGPGARTATSLWLAAVASAGLAWHLHPRLALALTAQMAVPMVYPHFEIRGPDTTEPVPLFTPAPVTGRLLVGLEARLGDPW